MFSKREKYTSRFFFEFLWHHFLRRVFRFFGIRTGGAVESHIHTIFALNIYLTLFKFCLFVIFSIRGKFLIHLLCFFFDCLMFHYYLICVFFPIIYKVFVDIWNEIRSAILFTSLRTIGSGVRMIISRG